MGLGWPWGRKHGKACYRFNIFATHPDSMATPDSRRKYVRPEAVHDDSQSEQNGRDAVKPVWRVWQLQPRHFSQATPATKDQATTNCAMEVNKTTRNSRGNSLATSNRNRWRLREPSPACAVPEISIGPPSAPAVTRPPEVNRRTGAVNTEEILI